MRAINWVVQSTLFAVLLYLAVWHDTIWARNIVIFFVWFSFVIMAIVLSSTELIDQMIKKGPPLPQPVLAVYDIAYLLVLVGAGWIFTAIAYCLAAVFEHGIYKKGK